VLRHIALTARVRPRIGRIKHRGRLGQPVSRNASHFARRYRV